MLSNHLIFALRHLKKRKLFSFINIFGLSVGVAVFLVILRYVDFELSYDRHHANGAHIYRTILTRYLDGKFRDIIPLTGYGTGPALKADIPEVKEFARMHEMYGGAVVTPDVDTPTPIYEKRLFLVDPAFLKMFTFKVVAGDLQTALAQPDNLVITNSIAGKYYPNDDALGRTLKLSSGFVNRSFIITAIIEDPPQNTSLVFDFLLPLEELLNDPQYREDDGWGWNNFTTYVETFPGTNIEDVAGKMPGFISRYNRKRIDISFQPLYDIHTRTGLAFDSSDRVSRNKVYFFILIAAFILAIAWINYINLATARAVERSREVGIKKVIGADKRQLVIQFLSESAIINFAAIALALVMAVGMLPFLENLVGKTLAIDLGDIRLWILLATLGISGTLASGLYPAFVLSSFRTTTALKGGGGNEIAFPLRKGLAVFQFTCSLILIALTLVVHRQVRYMESHAYQMDMDQNVLIEPSTWWDNKIMLKRTTDFLKSSDLKSRSLYIAQANPFVADDPRGAAVDDAFSATKQLQSTLAELNTDLHWQYKYYERDNHGSVAFIAEYDALRFIFEDYFAPFDKIKNAQDLKKHYQRFSEKIAVTFNPPEKVVNELAGIAMFFKRYNLVNEYYQMNIDLYPNSPGAYRKMASLWLTKGDQKKAIEYLQKCLQVDPANQKVKDQIANLTKALGE